MGIDLIDYVIWVCLSQLGLAYLPRTVETSSLRLVRGVSQLAQEYIRVPPGWSRNFLPITRDSNLSLDCIAR